MDSSRMICSAAWWATPPSLAAASYCLNNCSTSRWSLVSSSMASDRVPVIAAFDVVMGRPLFEVVVVARFLPTGTGREAARPSRNAPSAGPAVVRVAFQRGDGHDGDVHELVVDRPGEFLHGHEVIDGHAARSGDHEDLGE